MVTLKLEMIVAIVILALVGAASLSDAVTGSSSANAQAATTTATATPNYLATIAAQRETITDLKATVAARGKKINAQRTQIADLRTEVAAMPAEPTATATEHVTDPYIAQLLIDYGAIDDSMTVFDREIAKGANADPGAVFGALDTWINTYNTYAGTVAPAPYTDLHEDWLWALGHLNDAATTFYAYLLGSGDDVGMQAAMVDYVTMRNNLREDVGPRITRAQ